MASIPMRFTTGGLNAIASAIATSANVTITHIELGTGHSANPASLTSLVTPMSPPVRLDATFGGRIAGTTSAEVSFQDVSLTNAYEVREIGLFAGTVLITYHSVAASEDAIAIKHANTALLFANKIHFVNGDTSVITLPHNAMTFVTASETMHGLVRKATDAELTAGVEDDAVAVSPADVIKMLTTHVLTPLTPTVNIFTANGTWTKPDNAVRIKVELWGGGAARNSGNQLPNTCLLYTSPSPRD